jgi:transketolase
MRDAFVKSLLELAKEDKRIFLLTADIGTFTFDIFRQTFPNRFINFGIAEQNMMGAAAGLALSGKIPFVYTIAPFVTMRCFEQIRVDVCYHNLNVKIVGVGTGLAYGSLGPTHQTVEDIAITRALPNMTVISPADPLEAKKVTRAAVLYSGPVYIRLGRSGEPVVYESDYEYQIGRAVSLREGKEATLIATGVMVYNTLKAAEILSKEEGIEVRVINMHTLKPLDQEVIEKASKQTRGIITVEEHSLIGGLGSAVGEIVSEKKNKIFFRRIGLNDAFCSSYGNYEELKEMYGLSVSALVNAVKNILNER